MTSGLRLGTAALTTRGMKEKEMDTIGELIAQVLLNPKKQSVLEYVLKNVLSISEKFPIFSKEWE
jgi:glycine hydroxymethyltransferase